MRERIVGADVGQLEITSLKHIRGQPQLVETLEVQLRAYFNIRASSGCANVGFGPVLLTGPSGTGKSLVAKALHAELGNLKLFETNGVTINNKRELFSILIGADANTTIFIDEAQAMNSNAQHLLLTALSERKLHIPAGISMSRSYTLSLGAFTMIMATTHEYLLQSALRNRMRIYCRLELYSTEALVEIVRQRADALRWPYQSDQVLRMIAQRAKRIPRLALHRNLQTCWNVVRSHDRYVMTVPDAQEAFQYLQVDHAGLDQLDRSYLEILLGTATLP